jgi:putative FmdB family regulatory protein
MIYPYSCPHCNNNFDIIKRISEIDNVEKCPNCDNIVTKENRKIASGQIFYGAKVEDAEWCPGLGCIVKNSAHRRQIARARGLEEVGTEPVENMINRAEKIREENAKAKYAEFFQPIEVRG